MASWIRHSRRDGLHNGRSLPRPLPSSPGRWFPSLSSESRQISSTQTPAPAGSRGFLLDAWAAVKGTREDYTSGSLSRAITLLAIPMMLELVMESTFGLVDIYFVGKLGSDAVATVGLSGSVLVILFAIALGLSLGATALVARRIGEGDPEGAGRAAAQAILAGILFSLPLALAGVLPDDS